MESLVAVIEDERDIRELVSLHLKKNGFKVVDFSNGVRFINYLNSRGSKIPDLLILDLMLPDYDGFEICKYLKSMEKFREISIIILTARSQEEDKISGLELGADDYVTKPFSPKELVARVKAVLRRKNTGNFYKEHESVKVGEVLNINFKQFQVFVEGKRIELTPTEFKILEMFVRKRGWVFSREQILNNLWGNEKFVLDRTVDVHIKHLREKLGKAGKMIKSIRGVGYKLEEQ